MRFQANASNTTELRAFISYSHKDIEWRVSLETHLCGLRRQGLLTCWSDREICPGQDWADEIDANLENANIILLLISADFVASDYCWDIEMRRAIELHDEGKATVVPVIVRAVDGWEATPMGRFQALPERGIPLAELPDRDRGLADIASAIRALITRAPSPPLPVEIVDWTLTLNGDAHTYTAVQLLQIARRIRRLAADVRLRMKTGGAELPQLLFSSPRTTYSVVKASFDRETLSSYLEAEVVALSDATDVGASISILSKIMEGHRAAFQTTSTLQNSSTAEFPPLVTGMVLFNSNPMRPGLNLAVHPDTRLEQTEVEALQRKLGRYLNTFLVVPGDLAHVNLSPFAEGCGIPEPLRRTELGLALLKQDLDLKNVTTSLLHPLTETGKAFWSAIKEAAGLDASVASCLRVWIVPDDSAVTEKVVGKDGHITIDKMGLRVLSETDYETQSALKRSASTRSLDAIAIKLFREIVLPKLEEEVRAGAVFGELRQILSVLVLAVWLRRRAGELLSQIGFLDSCRTKELGLEIVSDEPTAIQREYQRLVREGAWQWMEPLGFEDKPLWRLYLAGGILLRNSPDVAQIWGCRSDMRRTL
jgi:hypothetical protein